MSEIDDLINPTTITVEEMNKALHDLQVELETRKFALQAALTISLDGASVYDIIDIAQKVEQYLIEGVVKT